MSTACAIFPTPVFNTPDIPFLSLPLKKDSQHLIREIEAIALPGTPFQCLHEVSAHILQVETPDYPSAHSLRYVDRRFLQANAPERKKKLPSRAALLNWLESSVGTRYFWGGNWRDGIPEMLNFYPHLQAAAPEDQDDALCRGLDCSGLLYQATDGITPRNTGQLILYGEEISPHEFQPLDLIVWKGHVLIVFSQDLLIESRVGHGVVMSPFQERYAEVVKLTEAENKTLHFRRWYTPTPPKAAGSR